MKLGKWKKLDEKKMVEWVNKALKKGSDMEQISNVLKKKFSKKEVDDFLKRNYSREPEGKPDKRLEEGLDAEKKKKEETEKIDTEMNELMVEAGGEEPETAVPEEIPGEEPTATPKGAKGEPKDVPIQRMSTYDIELLNQVASINHGIMELIKILKKE